MVRHKLNPDGTRADLNPVRGLVVASGTLIETYEVRLGEDGKPFVVKVEPESKKEPLELFICAVWRPNRTSMATYSTVAYTASQLVDNLKDLKLRSPELVVDVYITHFKNGEKTFSQTLP